LDMRLCFAIVPHALFLVLAVSLLTRYPLSHAPMEDIRARQEARRGRG
jgi:Na+/melibiose symporter-like transporter